MVIKAVITTLDNLPILKQQIHILRSEPIDEIIVVNNGSIDGTREWLETQKGKGDLVIIHRENHGAGPGRNAGLDAAGEFDYVLMLDGGIRPLISSTQFMLDYLESYPDIDVISPEIATCFTSDEDKADRRMAYPIEHHHTFPQRALSSTAYALCRYRAWDGIRFSEEGPFGEKGWGVDDNLMAYDWSEAEIAHRDFQDVLVYRHESGSFARLFKETGIWPNQYGSVYEQRNVMCFQKYPQYHDVIWQQGELEISVVMLGWNEYPLFVYAIKVIHEELADIPHEIIFVNNGSTDATSKWLDAFALRWHHGDTTIIDGKIIRRREEIEKVWTGNVIRVDLAENMGTGYGYTAGLERARGKYIFLTDGDIIPALGSIIGLKNILDDPPPDLERVDAILPNPHVQPDELPEYVDYEGRPLYCLGNFFYGFCLFRREIWDSGARHPTTGPFAGAGCGYDDAEFINQMYMKGFRGYQLNVPAYLHKRRDLKRSGHPNIKKNLRERRRWLRTRWPGQNFDAVMYAQPAPRHVRRVAIIGKGFHIPGDPGFNAAQALIPICDDVDCFAPGYEQEGYDDYLYIACGDWAPTPALQHPSIYWIYDMVCPWKYPHAKPDQYLEAAKTHDRVFTAQPSAARWLTEQGVEATWLPNAANEKLHKPHDVDIEFDWIALWHNCGERIPLIKAVSAAIPNGWVSWQDGEKYAYHMSRARCSLNYARTNETNIRVFESMAIGVPLITSRGSEGIDWMFKEGEHYLGFESYDECIEQIKWVNANPEDARAMADRARERVLNFHLYYHRILTIFGT